MTVKRTALWFTGPRQLELREEPLPSPSGAELLVRTELSAVSAGTEMLVYRGQLPAAVDARDDVISGGLAYPTQYGYAAVGRVEEVGPAADTSWRNRRVFAFKPHGTHFLAGPAEVIPVPDDIAPEDAVFLPNTETAVNLVQDSVPMLGECVLVLGQGVVGLLTAAILSRFPLQCLVTVDRYAGRRRASEGLGVSLALDPEADHFEDEARNPTEPTRGGYDLTLELTGNPSALNQAIALTGFSGRVVVGSWYGSKSVPVEFGGRYHRSRISMIASQVSTIAPRLQGRWNKDRRYSVAWEQLRRIRPSRWITHRFALQQAPEAYRLLDEEPESTIQLVFSYA